MLKVRKKKPNYLLIGSIVILTSVIVWNSFIGPETGKVSVATVRQGWVQHQKKVKAVFANTEIILTAPAEGKVVPRQEEGRRFKKGETVATITPSGVEMGSSAKEIAVAAPISGLFYLKTDKLEEAVTPENLMNMDLNALLTQVQPQATDSKAAAAGAASEPAGNIVGKNAPMGKIVNNLYPSWMFVYLEEKDELKKGDTVKFLIQGDEYAGTVMKISGQPRGAVIRFNQYINGTTENRQQEIIWNFKPASKGMLVPLTALYTFGEERGVYIGNDGIIRFVNVKVLDNNDTLACVEGIPEGVEVITNPKKGLEGQTLKK